MIMFALPVCININVIMFVSITQNIHVIKRIFFLSKYLMS